MERARREEPAHSAQPVARELWEARRARLAEVAERPVVPAERVAEVAEQRAERPAHRVAPVAAAARLVQEDKLAAVEASRRANSCIRASRA